MEASRAEPFPAAARAGAPILPPALTLETRGEEALAADGLGVREPSEARVETAFFAARALPWLAVAAVRRVLSLEAERLPALAEVFFAVFFFVMARGDSFGFQPLRAQEKWVKKYR